MLKYLIIIFLLALISCNSPTKRPVTDTNKGGLFIIGGGSRPSEMIDKLIELSNLKEGFGYILPMASSDDSAYYYANKQFVEKGLLNLVDYTKGGNQLLDSLKNASLIYLAGGDQRKLMAALSDKERMTLKTAYENGATIAGTSAGTAVMSHLMITGDEKRHPEYQSTFATIEKDNIIFDDGLGLLPKNIIIDQHFIYRSRYNRLLTAVIEKPTHIGIGIDESTAIYVKNDTAEVVGDWQVITFINNSESNVQVDNLLGAKNIQLNIYLPGEKFKLPND